MALTAQQESALAEFADTLLLKKSLEAKTAELNVQCGIVGSATLAKYSKELANADADVASAKTAQLQAVVDYQEAETSLGENPNTADLLLKESQLQAALDARASLHAAVDSEISANPAVAQIEAQINQLLGDD